MTDRRQDWDGKAAKVRELPVLTAGRDWIKADLGIKIHLSRYGEGRNREKTVRSELREADGRGKHG